MFKIREGSRLKSSVMRTWSLITSRFNRTWESFLVCPELYQWMTSTPHPAMQVKDQCIGPENWTRTPSTSILKYLKEIKPGLGEMLEWVGDVYRYDISL